jgi:hypothetical protein
MRQMKSRVYDLLRRTPARYFYHRIKALRGAASQSNEADILIALANSCPKTFVEFGFHPSEYNCVGLSDFSGLMVDGDKGMVKLARAILPERIEVRHQFLTLENMNTVANHHAELGVLSIDVDGNDYWFLDALLPARPHVIVVEYNASFLSASLTVPYDPTFDRHQKDRSGWYHGASLSALNKLCGTNGYKLVAVAEAGGNAFFVRQENPLPAVDPHNAYRENRLTNEWSGTSAHEQWLRIKHLPYVEV